MKATSSFMRENLPDSLPGLLIMQHKLSEALGLKQTDDFFWDADAKALRVQNECLKRQLLELHMLTDRLSLIS